MKYSWVFWIIIALAVFLIFLVAQTRMTAQADFQCINNDAACLSSSDHRCCDGLYCKHIVGGSYKCKPVPTSTPTSTPRPTNTPTPTQTPGHHHVCIERECVRVEGAGTDSCKWDRDCLVTPTPTPTIVPPEVPCTNNCGNPPTFAASSTEAPQGPVCTIPIEAPKLQGFEQKSPTSVFWSWWASVTQGIEKQWIEYGYEKSVYPFNVFVPTDVTGFETGALDPNAIQHWARVCVMKNGCVACSNDLDP